MVGRKNWGHRPWQVNFHARDRKLPPSADYVIVGGGFTGLSAAAWLKRKAPQKVVALFEAGKFGEGSSGHTGGVVLAESAVGELAGLGDVLAGYQDILAELRVEGDLELPGAYELARSGSHPESPIRWKDSGDLCAVKEVVGGTINPGKVVDGLAEAAERNGVLLFDDTAVVGAEFRRDIVVETRTGRVRAEKALFATNAFELELSALRERAQSAFTTAVMTEPLTEKTIEQIGLSERKPFYTVELPYLWGRLFGSCVIFGCGLIFAGDWRELNLLDVDTGEAPRLYAQLEERVRGLHPALRAVRLTHRWGGPICIAEDWKPVFESHPESDRAIVLGAYSGHGVAQSVYLGAWAADVLLERRGLPRWR